jgi:regulator of protease activity HflC (stomatin/prohibitin superfamily)
MLFKFKSKAAGDLIMLEPNGRRVLEIIGKEAQPKGIILPEQMPAAAAALEAAIAKEEADQKAMVEEALAKGEAPPRFEGVSLRQRAVPFLDMLRRCQKANQEIVWGV